MDLLNYTFSPRPLQQQSKNICIFSHHMVVPFFCLSLEFSGKPCYFNTMEQYELIRSRRKSLALEITKDCRVLVRAPMRLSQERIDQFVKSHQAWIARHLEQQRSRAADMPPEPSPAEIAALKKAAWDTLPDKVAFWSRQMGVSPTGLKITTARKRYGSCNGKNSLCFSCFLMNCPEEAIDLVVVHELCHIKVRNHGPDFYTLLGQYLPDYQERKKLLK